MMIQQTSLSAYNEIKSTLGERQAQVYNILVRLVEATNKMISEKGNIPINCVTARIFELRELGLVKESYKDKCPISGRMAIFWRINDSYKVPQEMKVTLKKEEFSTLI